MPTRIRFGTGESSQLPDELTKLEFKRLLIVTDPGIVSTGIIDPISESLQKSGIHVETFDQVAQNPRDSDCLYGTEVFQGIHADAVLAIGGGSAMDTAKTIALLAKSGGNPSEYADGHRPYQEMAPVICVPTTAGTGSEVTRSAVITESFTHRKMTLKHEKMRPILAVLDPRLTVSVPASVTAATGVDALVHAIEGYTCTITSPISKAYGAEAMRTIIPALPIAVSDGKNLEARTKMLEGSLLAGLCFGNADVASVHCLAEALGSVYDTPHGIANAIFLPHVLRFNAQDNIALHADISRLMGYSNDAQDDDHAVEQLINGVFAFTQSLGIAKLRELPDVNERDFDKLAALAFANGSTPSNVRTITLEDYRMILSNTYHHA